ncbi:ABC-2 transporter permease [Paenibacillus sp. SC116]|uniref:ABC-2 transporter permease n=1 Tax=Paenibacillus sp. SC116 TaxID=2968986 RepID=UPI00215A95F9|nr:ABC-2 transporter permease [Paenibacillus sp. SC116]MCR8842426.1 ABC-2 transporter permease [Paenibacillus sp. SC116]
MLNLLRKDFIASKISLGMSLLIFAVFCIFFMKKEMSMHLVGIITAFATISSLTLNDTKNHNHQFLVTLPISRKHIVQAKFMASLICIIVAVLASYGVHSLVKLVVPGYIIVDYAIIDILAPIAILLVLTSIYLPLFYILSEKGAPILNGIFLFSFIVMADPVARFIYTASQNGVNYQILYTILLSTVLLFVASCYLTVYLFTKKDL